ncbi:hypothetical protein D3C75_614260 [compost metagenome]
MDHVALNRPRAHDRDFDYQVIEGGGLEPRQHGHLGAGFDLEHAHGLGTADHRVGGRVFGGDGRQGQVPATVALQQVEATAQGAEHAQRQHVDLEQADHVQVVLVPLDHRALRHRGILHRHQLVERLLGDDKTARVL